MDTWSIIGRLEKHAFEKMVMGVPRTPPWWRRWGARERIQHGEYWHGKGMSMVLKEWEMDLNTKAREEER